MSRYYNTTRGALVVALRDGSTACLSARAVLDLSPEQDGSADVLAKVRKGMLKKIDVPVPAPPPPPPPPPPPEPTIESIVEIDEEIELLPQDLVEAATGEVAEDPSSSVELDPPQEETPVEKDRRSAKGRRFGKHRS